MISTFKNDGFNLNDPDVFIFEENNYKKFSGSTNGYYDNYYFKYIDKYAFSPEYLDKVSNIVKVVAGIITNNINSDKNCIGKCEQISDLICHIFNRLEVNNYQVNGSLFIKHRDGEKAFDYNRHIRGTTRGHFWVVTPSYDIVDLTFSKQLYNPIEIANITGMTLRLGRDTFELAHVDVNGNELKYVPYERFTVNSPFDKDLNQLCTDNDGKLFLLNGKTPIEIFKEIEDVI